MVNRDELASLVIKLRKKKGYSQRKLALVSGVSNSTISRLENSASDTDPETLKALAPFLDISYDELMKVAGYIDEPEINIDRFKASDIPLTEEEIEWFINRNKPKEKYPDVHDVEEAMKIILEQPGLMLKGELLSDESKIILANAIQMGLRTAEEIEKKKKNKGDIDD